MTRCCCLFRLAGLPGLFLLLVVGAVITNALGLLPKPAAAIVDQVEAGAARSVLSFVSPPGLAIAGVDVAEGGAPRIMLLTAKALPAKAPVTPLALGALDAFAPAILAVPRPLTPEAVVIVLRDESKKAPLLSIRIALADLRAWHDRTLSDAAFAARWRTVR